MILLDTNLLGRTTDSAEPSDDPGEIELWDEECRRVGPFQYEPGERERVQAVVQSRKSPKQSSG